MDPTGFVRICRTLRGAPRGKFASVLFRDQGWQTSRRAWDLRVDSKMARESLAPLSPPEMLSQEAGRPDGTASPRRPCMGGTHEQAGSKRASSCVLPCMACGQPCNFPRSPTTAKRGTNATKLRSSTGSGLRDEDMAASPSAGGAGRSGPIPTYACTSWAQVLVRGRDSRELAEQLQLVVLGQLLPGASPAPCLTGQGEGPPGEYR